MKEDFCKDSVNAGHRQPVSGTGVRHTSGYRIATRESGQWLIPKDDGFDVYDAFSQRNKILAAFLGSTATEDLILKLANDWGILLSIPEHPDDLSEPLARWASTILSVQRVWGVWERFLERNRKNLVGCFAEWPEDPRFADVHMPLVREIEPDPPLERRRLVIRRLASGDWDLPKLAIQFITSEVNALLKPLEPRIRFSNVDESFNIEYSSDSLIGTVWFALATKLSTGSGFRQCARCGTWFEIGPQEGGYRKSRVYCKDACRVAAHQDRKRRSSNKGKPG